MDKRTPGAQEKAPHHGAGLLNIEPGGVLLSHGGNPVLSSALNVFTSEFGMGSGGSRSLWPPGKPFAERGIRLSTNAAPPHLAVVKSAGYVACHIPRSPGLNQADRVLYGQASRSISTGKLNALLRFHIPPINVVVFDEPSGTSRVQGDLILRGASRLDAFSVYPVRT